MRQIAGMSGLALLIALPFARPAPAFAQVAEHADARAGGGQALVGCWAPVARPEVEFEDAEYEDVDQQMLCIGEREDGAMAITTLAEGRIDEEIIPVDGAAHAARRNGCEAVETATWSEDGARLYLRSTRRCGEKTVGPDVARMLGLSAAGSLVDVRAVGADGEYGVRVLHYRPLMSDEYPASMRELADLSMDSEVARVYASAPLSLDDVIEAANLLPPSAVQAMLLSLPTHRIHVDDEALIALAEAGVQDEVIDVLVAVAYPEEFALAATGVDAGMADPAGGAAVVPGAYDRFRYDPYGYLGYGRGIYGYGGFYGRYYDSPFGYRHYPWGYDSGGTIIIIDRDNLGTRRIRGRAVNGRGYTRAGGNTSDGGDDEPRASPRSPFTLHTSSDNGRGYDPGGSASSTGGSRSGDSADSGSTRRARPKNP